MYFTGTDAKARHLKFLQLNDFACRKTNLIFRRSWYTTVSNIAHFFLFCFELYCLLSVLTQNEDILSFHGPLTLNKWGN